MKEFTFTGEFGYFNIKLLPFLEKVNESIRIHTFPDYCYILNNLFGNKFEYVSIPLHKLRLSNGSVEYDRKLPSLAMFLDNDWISKFYKFCYISKPITSEYSEDIKDFICFFPRYRNSGNIKTDFEKRNSNPEECKYVLDFFKNYTIIIVGNELLEFDFKKYENVKISDDIKKTAFYLKNCKFLISNDSGIVDFAKNCAIKHVVILRPTVEYHQVYNPFNSKIDLIENLEDIKKLI